MVGTCRGGSPVVGDDDERQGECEQCGLVVYDYVGKGCALRPIDFSEREDEQGNGDRDDAVAEGNNPVDDAYFSFTCQLIAPPFRKINFSKQAGVVQRRVGGSARLPPSCSLDSCWCA